MSKRKRATTTHTADALAEISTLVPTTSSNSRRKMHKILAVAENAAFHVKTEGSSVVHASSSSNGHVEGRRTMSTSTKRRQNLAAVGTIDGESDSSLSTPSEIELMSGDAMTENAFASTVGKGKNKSKRIANSNNNDVAKKENVNEGVIVDPEAEEDELASEEEEIEAALSRPPPVHSDYLPLPWKGRLGYACLNTYLRSANPPVFSSRTCRIASIMEHRHPLKDPSQPHHPTKNRPDLDQKPEIARGQAYVEGLGLANARDIIKMIRWNDKFGIKFMRLSSEMFPFASHETYGYKLAPFASEVLAEAGKVAAELGHRLTTHPGQFTQLGSPRKEVIENAIRDLEYHAELLSLLKLPPQLDRDAVMILHMGGVFGDKEATLDRFRENYKRLSQNVKNRLVLENDDVSWSVHDLLPICKELNIPMVLDFHHHNIIHSDKVREGTHDIMALFNEIKETWTRKGITQKMHYSEPESKAVTARQRRKHSPRVTTLPPCDPTMDLMIEAKDKEQAVFELMRTFKLPGWNKFNDIVPHIRTDENKPVKKPKKKATPKKRRVNNEAELEDQDIVRAEGEEEDIGPQLIPTEDVGMGGPEGRVYWPPGMEEWLRPPKRVIKKKDGEGDDEEKVPKKRKTAVKKTEIAVISTSVKVKSTPVKSKLAKRKSTKASTADSTIFDEDLSEDLPDLSERSSLVQSSKKTPSRRSARGKKVDYAEAELSS